ncbi:hypothetical protein MAPG_10702 [Magnaporthiopsis poae ATCC 64411]|uniref:Uncharacterized protein n=1 Tax=Magnaporthiopsis poae (strain ATCC 64411 / 73-15) TaxID=644358 RepID=A0A0C4EDA7_MAGP6|nr:hypothetical protein MAPG_10702 [Magnaporthiopsis poae ATCC 64411]
MRFSLLFHLGAMAALAAPVLAQNAATSDSAALAAGGMEEAAVLEARRDPGLNHLPKLPKPKPRPNPTFPAPPPGGDRPVRNPNGRSVRTRPGRGRRSLQEEVPVLEARRDPGLNHLPKRPKAAILRGLHPGFGNNGRRSLQEDEEVAVLEARRDPGLNALPKRPTPKPRPNPTFPPPPPGGNRPVRNPNANRTQPASAISQCMAMSCSVVEVHNENEYKVTILSIGELSNEVVSDAQKSSSTMSDGTKTR